MIPISRPFIGEEERQAVLAVLDSGMLAQGPMTARFEREFAELCGAKHGVAVSSGTAALHVALLAHGIGPGDEVITTPFTFIATVNAILFVGATPVFVDVEPDTWNIDPAAVEAAISPRTRAILPVHLFGHPVDMGRLRATAQRHGLALIEDAAQAVGAAYRGETIGSRGTACFSLYATKNLMSGEGGIVTTDDEDIATRLKLLRNHGMPERYRHIMLGYNLRMTDLHAAIGCAQLGRFAGFTAARTNNAAFLSQHITSLPTPTVRSECTHAWHQYTLRVPSSSGGDRDAAVAKLAKAGVGTGIFYPIPAHHQPHIIERGLGNVSLPIAEQAAREVLSIPVHPQLTQPELETIAHEVNAL